MLIRNAWNVIAWEHEVPRDGLFTRTVIGEPVLLYRTAGGDIVALEDRCCHRRVPLSQGRKQGDCVRCGHHGSKSDSTGACVEAPGLDSVPLQARVRRYPDVLRNRWVSELIADNLLDFSHLSSVHRATLGGSEPIARTRRTVDRIPCGIRVRRKVPSAPAPAFYCPLWDTEGVIDRWIDYGFTLPAALLMHSGAWPAGAAEDDDRLGVRFHSCRALTPETAHTTLYFFMESHRADRGSAGTTQVLFDGLSAAFKEDRRMITAQAGNLALQPGRPMLPLHMDAALTLFRCSVERELADQAAGAGAA